MTHKWYTLSGILCRMAQSIAMFSYTRLRRKTARDIFVLSVVAYGMIDILGAKQAWRTIKILRTYNDGGKQNGKAR